MGRQGDVRRGAPIGLADELLERREEVILVRDVVAGCVDPISAMGFGEGDEGACFERGEGAEHAVDHVEEVLDLLPWPGPHLEHLLRIDGHGGQQVVDVPEHLGERGGPPGAAQPEPPRERGAPERAAGRSSWTWLHAPARPEHPEGAAEIVDAAARGLDPRPCGRPAPCRPPPIPTLVSWGFAAHHAARHRRYVPRPFLHIDSPPRFLEAFFVEGQWIPRSPSAATSCRARSGGIS